MSAADIPVYRGYTEEQLDAIIGRYQDMDCIIASIRLVMRETCEPMLRKEFAAMTGIDPDEVMELRAQYQKLRLHVAALEKWPLDQRLHVEAKLEHEGKRYAGVLYECDHEIASERESPL